jgi:hypothetical protein
LKLGQIAALKKDFFKRKKSVEFLVVLEHLLSKKEIEKGNNSSRLRSHQV